jgi:hypothetical protein
MYCISKKILFECSFKKNIVHNKKMNITEVIQYINLTNKKKHPVLSNIAIGAKALSKNVFFKSKI